MKSFAAAFSLSLLLMIAEISSAQTTAPDAGQLDFGTDGLTFPPAIIVKGYTPRTVQLLGEAYRRNDPLAWKRAQFVTDLGAVALPGATPFLKDAMRDAAATVRAQAARSAALVGDISLLSDVEKLLTDPDANVRREAILATAKLAQSPRPSGVVASATTETPAITRGLSDPDEHVIAAAIQSAWSADHARQIAEKLPKLSSDLQLEAADALARLKATPQAPALLPLLAGDPPQRIAALRALGDLGDASQADAVGKLLADPHPTVRRAAVIAIGQLADAPTRQANAIRMLGDADPTVRQAAASVLTPVPSRQALTAIASQLAEPYSPLHAATRAALIHPADDTIRQATIDLAAAMLADPEPRRREDASYVLGHLHSDAAIERHVALLNWDPVDPNKSDWALIGQAAESLGLIGNAQAVDPLMSLVKASPIKPSPDALAKASEVQRNVMAQAMANALVSAARMRHRAALEQASRILKIDAQRCPGSIRAAAAFAVGVLAEPGGRAREASPMLDIYASINETRAAKIEAIKALGNLRHTPAADALRRIYEAEATPDMRWLAHWAYQRASNSQIAYAPPTEKRESPVSITDLP